MMFKSCPAESDPRDKVSDFISRSDIGSIGGLRLDGLDSLKDIVVEEIRKQEPESTMIFLDRDFICDNGIDFERDLTRRMDEMTSSGNRINWIIVQDLPIMDWQKALEKLNGRDTQVYFFTTACRQVPCCFKLIS